jgi:site-specific DNA-methyltransferase (adenine-specific)
VLKQTLEKNLFESEKEIVVENKTKDFSHHKGSMMSKETTENFDTKTTTVNITKGNSEYEGWGTALKPAHEPIVMARKPFKGTVAENVLEHGTGGINIDGCRVGDAGRFPANVMHDGSEVVQDVFGDKSRYYYCAKASKKDRDEGLDEFSVKQTTGGGGGIGDYLEDVNSASGKFGSEKAPSKNNHPTVKPTELMRYLCRLVTPKGGVVLDPFMGSGSTGKGALLEGFKFVGIEMEREYFDIACARLEAVQNNMQGDMFD